MKKLILLAALIGLAGSVLAQEVNVSREASGSGQPGTTGYENAKKWDNDIFHAPQYMPGYPTAAVLYPRIVEVQCKRSGSLLVCKGYNWTPDMGRGEYLMVRPVIVPEVKPTVVTNTVTIIKEVPVTVTKEVFIEMATKKIGE